MLVDALFADVHDARFAVGVEHHAEELREEVIEVLAARRVDVLLAIRAARKRVLAAAGSHLAPASLVVFVAPLAAAFEIATTGAAVQSTVGNEFAVRL